MKAILIKKQTDDGAFTMQDHVPLGKEYDVDIGTISMKEGYNFVKQFFWTHEMVIILGTGCPRSY